MVDKSRRDRVGLGLIGLGPSWEQVYRDAIGRLQSRLTIRLVYDPVEARARSVATEINAEVVSSLRQLLTRSSLQGVLVLEPGWCGVGALNLVASSGKPAYLGKWALRDALAQNSILRGPKGLSDGESKALKIDDQLFPELGLRLTPASCRLRELMATKLGSATQILIHADLSSEISEIATLVDWCISMMGQDPISSNRSIESSTGLAGFDLEFPSSVSGRRTAKLRQKSIGENSLRIEVECDCGHAVLTNRTQIAWKSSAEQAEESLAGERTETEILIDQFCRRALGGLNPVGRLSEILQAIEIAEAGFGRPSCHTGSDIKLNDRSSW